jgi:hypothetical protein
MEEYQMSRETLHGRHMGDKMEDKKRLDPKYLEQLAEEEYRELAGKLVRVGAINGYANEVCSDTFLPDMLGEPVIVRVNQNTGKEDIHRWMDEWLDPAYSVEIVERGNLPESLCSCWIYGNCRSLDGAFEPGDIYAVVASPKIARIRNTSKCAEKIRNTSKCYEKIDIQDIAKRLGAEICDPPSRLEQLVAPYTHRMRHRLEEEIGLAKDKELFEAMDAPTISEAVESYDQIAERQGAKRQALPKKPSLEEIVDSLRDRISALESNYAKQHATPHGGK